MTPEPTSLSESFSPRRAAGAPHFRNLIRAVAKLSGAEYAFIRITRAQSRYFHLDIRYPELSVRKRLADGSVRRHPPPLPPYKPLTNSLHCMPPICNRFPMVIEELASGNKQLPYCPENRLLNVNQDNAHATGSSAEATAAQRRPERTKTSPDTSAKDERGLLAAIQYASQLDL